MSWPSALGRRLPWSVTIRVRLTLWYVGLLAVILVAFSALLYFSLARSLEQTLDLSLSTEATRLIASVAFTNGSLQLGEAPDNLQVGTVAALYDRTGRRLLASDPRQPLPALPEALAQASQGQATLTTASAADGTPWRVFTTPVTEGGALVGILQVGRPWAVVGGPLRQLAGLLAIAVPGALLLASGGGLFLARRALDPIDRITRAAAAIGAEDLSRRLEFPRSQDEAGRLAATFDAMLERLDRAFRRQRQFTADASHELRTPLAMLASEIDVALAQARTPEEYARILRSLREDVARMSLLVNELLTLARADDGQQLLSSELLDLREILAEVVAAMQPLAAQRGITLAVTELPTLPVQVLGDQTRLTQLLLNLVDNALRYTSPGGSVNTALSTDSGWAILRVTDTGVGIAPEHLPHIFERFYRADPARAGADGAERGVGLGLAIAQWIAQAQGGSISVESELGRGSTFTVRLPLAPAPRAATPSPAQLGTAR